MALPKYQKLKDHLIEYIGKNQLQYSDPMPSEIELMNQFDLSRHTVRRAIADLVSEGWLYKKQGKGTFVSNPEANKTGHGKLIGVVTTYINDYIFPDIIHGIESVLSEHGYTIILGNTGNDTSKERTILKNMLNNNLAGLIIEPTKSVYPSHNKDLFDQCRKQGIPILFIHATYQNIHTSYIIEDDFRAGAMATNYLLDQGHESIAGIFKQDDMQGHGRCEGYIQSLRQKGLSISEDHILWYSTENQEAILESDKLDQMIEENTALVVYNEQIAVKLMAHLQALGKRIPEDISLISFDNSSLAKNSKVGLTTIAHPKDKLGTLAASSLLQMIDNKTETIEKRIPPTLVVRDSVKNRKS